jgi:hypothetical protein
MLFWMARRTVRSCTRRTRGGGGGGCLVVFLGLAALGGIAGTQNAPAPTPGPYGYTQGPNGLTPAYTPGGGGGHYIGGPAWTPSPPIPAHAPIAPIAPIAPAATSHWGLITLAAVITVFAGLAFIGARMQPVPILANIPQPNYEPDQDFQPCCGVPTGATHNTWCPNRRPPDNPAKYSNRR